MLIQCLWLFLGFPFLETASTSIFSQLVIVMSQKFLLPMKFLNFYSMYIIFQLVTILYQKLSSTPFFNNSFNNALIDSNAYYLLDALHLLFLSTLSIYLFFLYLLSKSETQNCVSYKMTKFTFIFLRSSSDCRKPGFLFFSMWRNSCLLPGSSDRQMHDLLLKLFVCKKKGCMAYKPYSLSNLNALTLFWHVF